MNPLKKAASLLKGKSVKQVQIDSDSDSEVDSKSSTPMRVGVASATDGKKKNFMGSTLKSTFSPTPTTPSTPPTKPMFSPDPKTTNKTSSSANADLDAQLKQLGSTATATATAAASKGGSSVRSDNNSVNSQSIPKQSNHSTNSNNSRVDLPSSPSDRSINQQQVPGSSQSTSTNQFTTESHQSHAQSHAPPPPPPSSLHSADDLKHQKNEQKIAKLEHEITQLRAEKQDLLQSLADSRKTIDSLERNVAELTQEENEMRTELFSKYDEIKSLEESKERLNAQYREIAKQLQSLESAALNQKRHETSTSSSNSLPVASQPPPPPSQSQSQSASMFMSSNSTTLRRDEEVGELRHQLKETEEKIKTQKSLTESKQLMNMKLDARNRELIQQLDHLKSVYNKSQHDGLEKDHYIQKLKEEIADYQEKYDGPNNIDKRKIKELLVEIDKLNESLLEQQKVTERQEEKNRLHLIDIHSEMEFLRKLVREYEGEIESLEKMLEEESSEMTQLLIRMKGTNEGLYRFLQAIFRRYKEFENIQNESVGGGVGGGGGGGDVGHSPRDHSAEEKEKANDENNEGKIIKNPFHQPILDLQDLIFLLDSNIMTLKVKAGHRPLHQMLTQLSRSSSTTNTANQQSHNPTPSSAPSASSFSTSNQNSPRRDRPSLDKPERPPPMSAGGKVSQEFTLKLLDFMDKYQLSELTKHFRNVKLSSEDLPPNTPSSPGQLYGSDSTPNRSPMKLGSSTKSHSKKPPVMMTPFHETDSASVESHSTTTSSVKTKGSEYVCFTINRGDGRPDEKWLEIVDSGTSLKYYFNPQTGVTQWELPIQTKGK